MTDTKKCKRKKDFTVEELYQNKNFAYPKEKNLETIFEEPKEAKDGLPILTSTRKYRRYLDFDPSKGKIQKRKKNAKKCVKKLTGNRGRTRSITKAGFDINPILEAIENSSDDSLTNISLNQSDCNIESNENDCSYLDETIDERENINFEVCKANNEVKSTLCDKVANDEDLLSKEGVKNFINVAVLGDKCVCLKRVCSCKTLQTRIDKSDSDSVELVDKQVSES